MSLPGAFSDCKRFWGVKIYPAAREKKVRVNSGTKLHITNVMVDFGNLKHKDNCSFSVGVRYEPDPCDCDVTKQSCSLHNQQQGCLICIIVPEKKEADMDLNFVGGRNLTFYYSENCSCGINSSSFSVNISGYEEVRG